MRELAEVGAPQATEDEQQVLVIEVRSRDSALERVFALLRRRASGAAITMSASAPDDLNRLTVSLRGTRENAAQLARQLEKLVDVEWAAAYSATSAEGAVVLREFALIRVRATATTRREIFDVARLFDARVLDVGETTMTLEVSGTHETIENVLRLLRPLGVAEVVRSGRLAMRRTEIGG